MAIASVRHIHQSLMRLRLSYDAAISKLERIKHGKKEKEKERKDAEEDLENAKAR